MVKVSFETRRTVFWLLWRFLVALLVLLLTQVVFAVVNRGLFALDGGRELWRLVVGNLKFGSATVCLGMIPVSAFAIVLYFCRGKAWQQAGQWLYVVSMGVILAVNIIDIPYYQWTLRRMTGEIFSYVSQSFDGEWGTLAGQFLRDFWPYFLLFFLSVWLLAWLSSRLHLRQVDERSPWWQVSLGVAVTAVLLVFGLRGGLLHQLRPLSTLDATRYASPSNTALVVNSPFSIYRTLGHQNGLQRVAYFSDPQELESVFTPLHCPSGVADSSDIRNVVLIILESFGEEYVGSLNGGRESWTPFLDSLVPRCVAMRGLANGKRSIESLPSLLTGIPSLMNDAYITSPFSQSQTLALPQIMKQHGMQTAFFHGAYNGSMNFDSYTRLSGVDLYYGMDQYDGRGDYDGMWGIFDEPFLQFACRTLDTFSRPFFATLYTISSHHPYTVPEAYATRFKSGPLPILETVGYADYALMRFFQSASQSEWYAHTLFVITADHAAQPLSPRYKVGCGQFAVPMLFFCPGGNPRLPAGRLMQHADLMPTLVDLMRWDDCTLAFGTSACDSASQPFHIAFMGDYYQLTEGGYTLTFDGSSHFALFDAMSDTLLRNDLYPSLSADSTVVALRRKMMAVVQQYNLRLLDNRLLPEAGR